MFYSSSWIFDFQVHGTVLLNERPVEEKKAQPATSPNSMQEYSPTVTGETKQIKVSWWCSVSFLKQMLI